MSVPKPRSATYADIEALPPHVVGEIAFGVLHTHPRPAPGHGNAAIELQTELVPPFRRGRGGPGGWILHPEPELHLGPHIVVPDIGGWRRERMPEFPDVPAFTLASAGLGVRGGFAEHQTPGPRRCLPMRARGSLICGF